VLFLLGIGLLPQCWIMPIIIPSPVPGTSSDSRASPFDPNAFKHHSNSCTAQGKLFLFLGYNPAYRHLSPLIDKVDAEKVQQNTPKDVVGERAAQQKKKSASLPPSLAIDHTAPATQPQTRSYSRDYSEYATTLPAASQPSSPSASFVE
jgi:hypothetical protein